MADEEENEGNAPEVEGEEGEGGGGSKKKLIIIIVAAVVLLGGIGAGAAMFLGGSSEGEKTEEGAEGEEKDGEAKEGEAKDGEAKDGEANDGEAKDGEEEAEAKKKAEEEGINPYGEVFTFKPFHLNLGNPLENRYIRLEIALEYKGGGEQKLELDAMTPRLRDSIIIVTSKKSREFLLGPDGKSQLRKEILIKMNQYLKKPVQNVFITDIIIE